MFVLLFGVGEAETEGIYSLRAMSREEGLPQDTIVAFEDLEDAERCVRAVNPPYTHIYIYIEFTSHFPGSCGLELAMCCRYPMPNH